MSVRVFADLLALYHAEPVPGEMMRIPSDFTVHWVGGAAIETKWATYDGAPFNESSVHPSKTVPNAKLDALRHQRSQPLSFGDVLPAYDHVRNTPPRSTSTSTRR